MNKRSVALLLSAIVFIAAVSARARWDEPARAEKWMVSSGHELATEAGLEILFSPMVDGYGILLGIRMTQFRLKNGHCLRDQEAG
jgi:gamma-glutamyltranspeptidase